MRVENTVPGRVERELGVTVALSGLQVIDVQ